MSKWLRRLIDLERAICRAGLRGGQRPLVQRLFAIVSRLGDGVFWYLLMLSLALFDPPRGLEASIHMLLTGAVAMAIYKSIKAVTRRERPCNAVPGVRALVPPLDHYSFPSGHTLHAVSFSAVALNHYPSLGWVLVPFTVAVAASRVMLGLHYPSDVLVAVGMGLILAYGSIQLGQLIVS